MNYDWCRQGWLPDSFMGDGFPPMIRWVKVGSTRLTEPFYWQTVERACRECGPVQTLETDLQAIIDIGETLPSIVPAGLIFHVTRCGSTLVANAMRIANRTVVVCEHDLIS